MPQVLATYIIENKLKALSAILGIMIMFFTIIGYIPNPFEAGAMKVYEQKRGEMEAAVESRIELQKLVQEPRFQRLETIASENQQDLTEVKKKLDDSMLIQREILEEVKKGNR